MPNETTFRYQVHEFLENQQFQRFPRQVSQKKLQRVKLSASAILSDTVNSYLF